MPIKCNAVDASVGVRGWGHVNLGVAENFDGSSGESSVGGTARPLLGPPEVIHADFSE